MKRGRSGYVPLPVEKLALSAMDPVDDNIDRALAYVAHGDVPDGP